jgi:hypothetical protein
MNNAHSNSIVKNDERVSQILEPAAVCGVGVIRTMASTAAVGLTLRRHLPEYLGNGGPAA